MSVNIYRKQHQKNLSFNFTVNFTANALVLILRWLDKCTVFVSLLFAHRVFLTEISTWKLTTDQLLLDFVCTVASVARCLPQKKYRKILISWFHNASTHHKLRKLQTSLIERICRSNVARLDTFLTSTPTSVLVFQKLILSKETK